MTAAATYRFDRFQLSPAARQLLVDGKPVPVGARAFDTLLALIERRDRTVTKNELLELVWPGLVVEENNLQVQVSTLRKLLGPQVIATIPGRGYRFTAPLDGAFAEAATPALAQSPRLPHLYGREADLAALPGMIDTQRLVTIVGAGGIGKSRLAEAVMHACAARWRDGACMVELAGLADPSLLPNTIAQQLHLPLPGHDPHEALLAALADRGLLLVLDNCEHLLNAVASLAQTILQRAPDVTILATSQEPLHLPGEQQYRVQPLAVPESAQAAARKAGAIALFEARVRAIDPRFELNDETLPLAIEICRQLDGLPLAIELAAARAATLGVQPVRDKLDARFRLLTGGARTQLRRHQTLRAALEWSHNLLNDAERAVFRRLGVFAGGFTMQLAQAVAVDATLDEWAVLDHLSALVDKSLVVADLGAAPRYRMLESARAFALEQLAAAGETDDMLKRHALALRNHAQRVDGENLDGELRTHEFAARMLPELDNLRAAHAWAAGPGGDPAIAVALAAHCGALIDYTIECADWLLPLRAHVENGEVDAATEARYWRALAAANMGDRLSRSAQEQVGLRALALYEKLGQPRRMYSTLIQLARHRNAQRNRAGASEALAQARGLLQPDWPAEFRIFLLRMTGYMALDDNRIDDALAGAREEVRIAQAAGDWRLQVIARSNLVNLLWRAGPPEDALREGNALVAECAARPPPDGDLAMHLANMIGIASESGRLDEAVATARAALPVMRRAMTFFTEEWVYLFWRRGQHAIAARLLGASDADRLRFQIALQHNEQRLIGEARTGLEAKLGPDRFAQALAEGAALSREGVHSLLADGLGQGGSHG